MQLKQNPFSFYDFLGYLIPGSVLLMSVIAWASLEGHICSVVFCPDGVGGGNNNLTFFSWLMPVGFILVSYVLGFVLSLVSSLVVEHYLILRKNYPSKYRFRPVVDSVFAKCSDWSVRDFLCLICAWPIVWLDMTLGVIIGLEKSYFKSFSGQELEFVKPVICSILKKIHPENKISLEEASFNWHQYIYHYVYENETRHASKIQNYVALYGFSRTAAMVFILLSWISPIAYWAGWVNYSINACLWHVFLFSGLSYFFFLGFAKFYRRYTDEILMAAVALETKRNIQQGT